MLDPTASPQFRTCHRRLTPLQTHAAQRKGCYSIARSARATSVEGTARPSAFAVLTLDAQISWVARNVSGVCPFEDPVDERACASVQGRYVLASTPASHCSLANAISAVAFLKPIQRGVFVARKINRRASQPLLGSWDGPAHNRSGFYFGCHAGVALFDVSYSWEVSIFASSSRSGAGFCRWWPSRFAASMR